MAHPRIHSTGQHMTDIPLCMKNRESTILPSRSVSIFVDASSNDLTKWFVVGRFELFIDLIWVGIISNLAQHFSDQAFGSDSTFHIGADVFEFIVLFMIAWHIGKISKNS